VTTYSNAGLTAGTTYLYRVRATNAGGDSVYSSTTQNTTLTVAPTGLTASAVSSSQINLTWSNVAGETGYLIERSPNGSSSWTQIATTAANVTTYSNTGLNPSMTYYYRVRATNAGGNSAYSNSASATTQASVPNAPSNLTYTILSNTSVRLNWLDNSTNETGFKIERSTNGTSWSQIATVGANVTTYTNTGLNKSRTYYYRVRAYNAVGNSPYSNTVTVPPR
jgi:predicted phage tail protein